VQIRELGGDGVELLAVVAGPVDELDVREVAHDDGA
jgi:hypothetical protein